ncbi:hypothetical protein AMECASPLE_019879 [Ameca splendens]|uniref:Secreted protein n=1 Tax=Ameca splendens TaxID=208324 RepID=A0ABV0ZQM1_9TELE
MLLLELTFCQSWILYYLGAALASPPVRERNLSTHLAYLEHRSAPAGSVQAHAADLYLFLPLADRSPPEDLTPDHSVCLVPETDKINCEITLLCLSSACGSSRP